MIRSAAAFAMFVTLVAATPPANITPGWQFNTGSAALKPGENYALIVRCAKGERIISGGYELTSPAEDVHVTLSSPRFGTDTTEQGWAVGIKNVTNKQIFPTIEVYAYCR